MKRWLKTLPFFVVVGVFILTAAGDRALAKDIAFFRIGTGSLSGTYYPVGSLIASVISNPPGSRPCDEGGACGVPGLIGSALSTRGSVANLQAVRMGELESGLAQSDIVDAAFNGVGVFRDEGAYKDVRVIANLYPESMHLVVRRSAAVLTLGDLAGRRVSVDTPGSGTRVNASLVLEAFGVPMAALEKVEVTPDVAIDLLLQDELDAFFIVAGYPTAAVTELANAGKINLLSISGSQVFRLLERRRYFVLDSIPAGTYRGISTTETISVGAQWVVDARISEELGYELTRALWHPKNRSILDSGHDKAELIRIQSALTGVSAPLHPGAERYYREVGILK